MAAKKQLSPLDMTGNEVQNVVAQNLASSSSMTKPGQYCYDTVLGRFVFRGASGVIDPTNRTNHTGTQVASTISDLASTVQAYRLDQFGAPTAAVGLNGQKLTNVANGTSASDAATYGQLLNVQNGTDWKNSVRIATTANITLSGLTAIDGITPNAGDRVLVKNQTTGAQNGLYAAASGAWARTSDAADSVGITPDLSVMVEEGTVNAGTQWRLTNTGAITVGTTALSFTQFGAGVSYTSGTGVLITGTVIAIDTGVVARKFAATIGDGSATSIAVSHGLGTLDVSCQLYDATSGATVETDVTRTSTSVVTLSFTTAPASNAYRVLITG